MNNYQDSINKMVNNINNHSSNIWYPDINLKMKKLNTNSWFSISQSEKQDTNFKKSDYDTITTKKIKCKSIRIILKLSNEQKNIINHWLNDFTTMYNYTVKYIKDNIIHGDNNNYKTIFNFRQTRSKLFNEKKNIIDNQSNIKYKSKVHDLDGAIKEACKNFKVSSILYQKGLIKNYRIRYWKTNSKNQIMTIEKINFTNNTIRNSILGKVAGFYNGKEFIFDSVKSDCIIQKKHDEYYLLVPIKTTTYEEKNNISNMINTTKKTIPPTIYKGTNQQKRDKKKQYIKPVPHNKKNKKLSKPKKYIDISKNTKKQNQVSIDLGIRKFATCVSENRVTKIKHGDKIKKYLKRLDKIKKNNKISKSIKKKNERITNKRISNLVDELHWKSICFLVKNHETILIGDINSKQIVKKEGNLNKTSKRILMALKMFVFKQRLEYKCHSNKVKIQFINEWMTSKMCSKCGNIKADLGSDEIYNCLNCKTILDRDVNGALNIHIKGRL